MDTRVNMIMNGAQDISKLRSFYEQGLGWTPWGPISEFSVMYKVGTSVLVFLMDSYLAAESGVPIGSGIKTSLAIFMRSKEEVDTTFLQAIQAGAVETSPIQERHGGFYSGYFADPEGNSWEVVWSTSMSLDADNSLTWIG